MSRERKYKTAPRIFGDVQTPDWAGLILELNRLGYPKLQIALALNTSRERVYSMARGNMPTWDVGQGLLALLEIARQS